LAGSGANQLWGHVILSEAKNLSFVATKNKERFFGKNMPQDDKYFDFCARRASFQSKIYLDWDTDRDGFPIFAGRRLKFPDSQRFHGLSREPGC
jgi:hypothetical protein